MAGEGKTTHEMYRTGEGVRSRFGTDRERAFANYRDLLDFVAGVRPPAAGRAVRLLDVGCGTGWSTAAFAAAGYAATGVDLNPAAFEPPHPGDGLRLVEGSALALPVPDGGFDAVVCYQCLEHVPDPAGALREMARACAPGGVVCVVGPNLVSPSVPVRALARPSLWPGLLSRRTPDTPRHPYGHTLPEVLGALVGRTALLAAKLVRPTPRFTMREPDARPPYHADNDACYLCNPTDLIAFFRALGFEVVRRGRPGRPPLAYLVAGGTWVAARKPAAPPVTS